MPPKRSSRGAKAPSKPRAERPKAKAMNESAALKEAMRAASKEVRSPSRSPEESHGEHASRKSPDAPPDEEEDTSEGSAQATNDKNQAEGDVPNAPADPDTQAEEPSSGKTGTEPMAAPPVKILTLAEGIARAQLSRPPLLWRATRLMGRSVPPLGRRLVTTTGRRTWSKKYILCSRMNYGVLHTADLNCVPSVIHTS
ncbi:uncharacterized protein IUM83_12174 [Phytophthora cinnamomi]|uniref:uncharacterized protein n=1 Tax=Phytophthora cinnamomi TaxID=4785 RepID=UPI00355A4853|nr:hypothetical protein IUM83_12174 [Phytophthora cinnamomi]